MQIISFKKPQFWFYLIMGLFGLLYLTVVICNHYFFRSFTYDYGVFNNDYWNLAHFHLGNNPIYHSLYYTDKNTLQVHFTGVLIYLLPFYWLLNWLTGSYTLVILQELLVLLAGWAVYRLIDLKTGNKWLGILALLYYFLLHGHYSAFSIDFNEAIVCASFIPLFLYAFESNRLKTAGVLFILSLFGREDMPLYFMFIFLALILWHRKEKKIIRVCIYGIGVCIIYFALVFSVFIPLTHSGEDHYYLFEYSALGKTPWDALVGIITNPIRAIELLFINHSGKGENDWIKAEFYIVYMASGAFFALYRPRYFIWFIPMLAQKMYNDEVIRWGIEAYYSIFVVTLLPISVFMAIADIYPNIRSRIITGMVVCVMAGMVTYFVENSYVHAIGWISTLKENIFSYNFNHPGYDAEKVHSLLKEIPPDAYVCASQSLVSHLAQRKHIYLFPYRHDALYIAVFAFHDYFEISSQTYGDSISHLVHSPQWNLIGYSYPLLLFKKEPNLLNSGDVFICRRPAGSTDEAISKISASYLHLLFMGNDSLLLDKKDFPAKDISSFSCDCETISNDGKSPLASDGIPLVSDGVSCEKAHSGKKSIMLTPSSQYGLNRHFTNLKEGDLLQVTVWRNSTDGKGCIVIANNNNSVYYVSGTVGSTDSAGWQKLYLAMIVPANCPKLLLYVWAEGSKEAFFDDMQVELYKNPD